ncbi:MAG TPA: hypothetical protein DDZ67_05900 [Xanthomonadaceae bacterium]|nr:hypothetical protein [Xanthomonadaceae bacterium]
MAASAEVRAQAAELDPQDMDVINSESFMSAHPDQLNRLRGLGALRRGENDQAIRQFRIAARYADKLSQALLAQLLWSGNGVTQDRALAYAWMDLAAERGTPLLVADRERYWQALSPEERERALHEGKAIYAEYADKVAKPRLEREMRVTRKETVPGSRIGANTGQLTLCVGDWTTRDGQLICNKQVSSLRYYQKRFWEPAQYWAWQDQVLAYPSGTIEVGAPQQQPVVD